VSVETGARVVPHDHVVQFYAHDAELIVSATRFLAEGLLAGEAAIIVGTSAHAVAFEAAIAEAGVDIAEARRSERLITLDADEAMSRITIDGSIDADAFADEIGGLISRAGAPCRRVRIYGEMVALLWDAGRVAEAIELESLWNDLGRRVPFALFCAYPAHSVANTEVAESFLHVCHLHSAVVGDSVSRAPFTDALVVARAEDARSFACELQSPSLARRFVADALHAWGLEAFIDDASIVVAELATNSVVHARSEFIVAVSSGDDNARVSVRDASKTLPTVQDPGPYSISGRGLMLVAAISQRWGVEMITDGKVVWAELGPNLSR
jgi:anti-sigma regulatory factor (Ser/Thr protein kinase)